MPFERSQEIERRLDEVLRLIRTGRFSTPKLAEEIGVSIPTISRCVTALRERGHDIESKRTSAGWRYVVKGGSDSKGQSSASKHATTVSSRAGSHDN